MFWGEIAIKIHKKRYNFCKRDIIFALISGSNIWLGKALPTPALMKTWYFIHYRVILPFIWYFIIVHWNIYLNWVFWSPLNFCTWGQCLTLFTLILVLRGGGRAERFYSSFTLNSCHNLPPPFYHLKKENANKLALGYEMKSHFN